MNGKGFAGNVGIATRYGVVPRLKGAADTIRPIFALGLGQAMPPREGRFLLWFICNEGGASSLSC